MNYAKGIAHARARAGLSKRRLATLVGVDPSYIAHIEAGRKKPSLEVIERFAEVLKLPVPLLMLMSADASDLNGIGARESKKLSEMLLSVLAGLDD